MPRNKHKAQHRAQRTAQRQRKQEARAQRNNKRQARERRADRFPNYDINAPKDAPQKFVHAVTQALKAIRHHPNRYLGEWGPPMMRVKRDGFRAVWSDLNHKYANQPVQDDLEYADNFLTCIGEAITTQLSIELINAYFPECWFTVRNGLPLDNNFTVNFYTLRRSKTPGGTAYYGPSNPQVTIEGRKRTLAFSRHAMERIAERACNLRPYYSRAVVCGYLHGREHYQSCELPTAGPAIAIGTEGSCRHYDPDHINRVLFPTDDNLIYRIGYAPIVFFEHLAIAKTFLPCGMRNTPEEQILKESDLPVELRAAYQAKIIEFAKRGWLHPHEVQILEWFAEQGHLLITPAPNARPKRRGKPFVANPPYPPNHTDRNWQTAPHTIEKNTGEPHSINQFAVQSNLLESVIKNPPIY